MWNLIAFAGAESSRFPRAQVIIELCSLDDFLTVGPQRPHNPEPRAWFRLWRVELGSFQGCPASRRIIVNFRKG